MRNDTLSHSVACYVAPPITKGVYKDRNSAHQVVDGRGSMAIGDPGAGYDPSGPPPAPGGDGMPFKVSGAMTMAARVLESGTSYATALYLNIQHFDRAIRAEERISHLEDKCDRFEKWIEELEKKLKAVLKDKIPKQKGAEGNDPEAIAANG